MVLKLAALNKLILRLEVSHVVFGGLCFGRVMYYTAQTSVESGEPLVVPGKLLFFLLVTFMMLAVSVMMFFACLVERLADEGKRHFTSFFEVLLYGLGCFLYLTATLSLIIHILNDTTMSRWTYKRVSFIGAAMFASWNTITYAVSLWAFCKLHTSVRLELEESDVDVLIG